jgi:hypothetical protein
VTAHQMITEAAAGREPTSLLSEARGVRVSSEKYSWGLLVKIDQGLNFRAVIHPEHHDVVKRGGSFKDEQGTTWIVTLTDGGRRFQSGSQRMDVKASDLSMILMEADLTEGPRLPIAWKNLNNIVAGRKNITRVCRVLAAMNPQYVSYLQPADADYARVKKKWERKGRPFGERGMHGTLILRGGKQMFVGELMGMGPVILAHSDFPA